jgi:hypothetical protein
MMMKLLLVGVLFYNFIFYSFPNKEMTVKADICAIPINSFTRIRITKKNIKESCAYETENIESVYLDSIGHQLKFLKEIGKYDEQSCQVRIMITLHYKCKTKYLYLNNDETIIYKNKVFLKDDKLYNYIKELFSNDKKERYFGSG